MIEKRLGKISSVRCGFGGYQEAMIGYGFTITGDGWGVSTQWDGEWSITRSEFAKWTESGRINNIGESFMRLADILNHANKTDIFQLEGLPVEVEFEDMQLKSWRVLKEVL